MTRRDESRIAAVVNGLETEKKLAKHTNVPVGLIDRIKAMVDTEMEGVDTHSRWSNSDYAWRKARDFAEQEGVTDKDTLNLLANIGHFHAKVKLVNLGIED